ncbi:uncharacterized protein LOC133333353 [Musca vetustissima]|uniref:uncharacterized protein LOC133333353 n=1 Tax=Musca vetustissima TaxID=27455 RepID=UPI002AB686FB|nr:uncharacterized protein LOC133333353 [Musca vetustissima]
MKQPLGQVHYYDQVIVEPLNPAGSMAQQQQQQQSMGGIRAVAAVTNQQPAPVAPCLSANQRISSSTLRSSNNGPVFVVSKYGTKQLLLKQHTFNRHVIREDVTYWRCSQFAVLRCKARIKTKGQTLTVLNSDHNHEVITQARKYGSLKNLKAERVAKVKQDECFEKQEFKSEIN